MEQHKQNIARLLESDLQNAPLAHNLSKSADLQSWFLGCFFAHERIRLLVDFIKLYNTSDQEILFKLIGFETCPENLQIKNPDLMVCHLSELAIKFFKYREIIETLVLASYGHEIVYSENFESIVNHGLMCFFGPMIRNEKWAKMQSNFPSGGIMSDHIDFIGQNAPTGEFVIAKNMLKVQKRLSHASR